MCCVFSLFLLNNSYTQIIHIRTCKRQRLSDLVPVEEEVAEEGVEEVAEGGSRQFHLGRIQFTCGIIEKTTQQPPTLLIIYIKQRKRAFRYKKICLNNYTTIALVSL